MKRLILITRISQDLTETAPAFTAGSKPQKILRLPEQNEDGLLSLVRTELTRKDPTAPLFCSDNESLSRALSNGTDTVIFLDQGERSPEALCQKFLTTDTVVMISETVYETLPDGIDCLTLLCPPADHLPYTFHTSFPTDKDEATLTELFDLLFSEDVPALQSEEDSTDQEQPTTETTEKKTEPTVPIAHAVFEWLELFAISLVAVLLIMTFFIRHSPVSGDSMLPTLHSGDVLILSEIGFTPESGDIVIIQTPLDDLRKPLVKRVIATSGQTIRINFETWEIFVNGKRLDEPYLDETDKSYVMELYFTPTYFEKVDPMHEIYEATVPEHHIFVLGDNRQNSKDSRTLGFIDERHVIGEVVYRLLPFSSMGELN